jgi:hypothetical protein
MHMSNQKTAARGTHNQKRRSTWEHPWSTTNDFGFTSPISHQNFQQRDMEFNAIMNELGLSWKSRLSIIGEKA